MPWYGWAYLMLLALIGAGGFLAGASSIFYGEKLLTTANPDVARDRSLLERLKIESETLEQTHSRGAADGCAGLASAAAD